MTEHRVRRRQLAWELILYFCISMICSAVFYLFLYGGAASIAQNYLHYRGWVPAREWLSAGRLWLKSLCAMGAVLFFLWIFFILLSKKVSYLLTIIKGIEKMDAREMDFSIPEEGNDELAELAACINRLACSQRELRFREQSLRDERERFIRSMSHDIRNPLAAILARSEYMRERETWSEEEIRAYIDSVCSRAGQIRELTDRLLNTNVRKLTHIENGRFLMEQMASEWEASLEEHFLCQLSLDACRNFEWTVDPGELQRIFDNLMTNIERYGNENCPVSLEIKTGTDSLCITQENVISKNAVPETESRGLGIAAIRQIAELYQGSITINRTPELFHIEIVLKGLVIL